MYMDKIHNHEVAGSIPAPATKKDLHHLQVFFHIPIIS